MSAYSIILLLVGAVIGWFAATCFWSLYSVKAHSEHTRADEAGMRAGRIQEV